jgi:RNA polymerase sigma factor (sigma-70 family)
MHDLTTTDDSNLLAEWANAQNQNAFTVLVRKYQSLVFGAALRRAEEPEVARDVCQQVFSLVASRARLLIGHANIAGWLYGAATHMAGRIQRGEARRRARQENYQSATSNDEPGGERWVILEEALGSLGSRDREALVLHYFQDLSYPEMASALGIELSTARQRVCRALEKLGKKLRAHGYTGGVPVLLASAASWTATAQAALPAGASAAAAGASPSVGLTLSAIFSHAACKIAAGVILASTIPWLWSWTAHADPGRSSRQPPVALAPSFDAPPTEAERQSFAELRAARTQADWRVADLSRLAQNAGAEILEPLGTMEELARKAARTARVLMKSGNNRMPPPDSPEWDPYVARALAAAEGIPQFLATARNLNRVERDAAKAGRFYAVFTGELLELDEPTRGKLEENMRAWVLQMQQEGLALPQRPRENTGAWDVRRLLATEAQLKQVFTLLPPSVLEQNPELKELQFSRMTQNQDEARTAMDFLFGQKP